jgi:hypothetical protein
VWKNIQVRHASILLSKIPLTKSSLWW